MRRSALPSLAITIALTTAPLARAEPPKADAAPPAAGEGETVTVDNNETLARVGVGLTVTGLITTLVAGVLVGVGNTASGDSFSEASMVGFVGLVMFIPAGVLTLTGIPLWIAGEVDVDVPPDDPRALEQRHAMPPGLTFTHRF